MIIRASRTSVSRAIRALALSFVMCAGVPAASQGATISFSGNVMTYNAAAGESNNLSLVRSTLASDCGTRPAPCIEISDGEPSITSFPASRCADDGLGTVECDRPVSVVANLGDRDDAMFDWDGPTMINGGPGNDLPLNGAAGADTINGGPGNDGLFGGDGNDILDGGDGNDSFEGFGVLTPSDPVTTGGTDDYIGGPGTDFVDYAGRTEPMRFSLNDAADDGAAGEADNVRSDIEELRGGNADDVITGSAVRNWLDGWDGTDAIDGGIGDDSLFGGTGTDTVLGGPGQDTIEGGDGDDRVDGGAGVDTLYGDTFQVCIPTDCDRGQDTILARDGVNDTVSCGPGEDSATLDAGDSIPPAGENACERVDRSGVVAPPPPPPPTPGAGVGATDVTVPQLRNLQIGKLRRGRSTTVRYSLSEPATVTFTIERRVKSRWVKLRGSFRHAGKSGSNSLSFKGRLNGRKLRIGSYRLVAVARDKAGNQAPPKKVTFKVVR